MSWKKTLIIIAVIAVIMILIFGKAEMSTYEVSGSYYACEPNGITVIEDINGNLWGTYDDVSKDSELVITLSNNRTLEIEDDVIVSVIERY